MRRGSSSATIAPGLVTALILAACATRPPALSPALSLTAEAPVQPTPAPPAARVAAGFSALPGWDQEDHAAALAAFEAGCGASHDLTLAIVCRQARDQGRLDEPRARVFLERNFQLEPLAGTGLLTAYFTPVYDARDQRGGEFTAPVRPRPADLPAADAMRRPGAGYADRAAIESRPALDAVAWMRPEDLFFLQIQGSGVLVFSDGRRAKAVFDGANGAPFQGIATPMRRQGLLADQDTSGEAIRAWLAAHRGAQADAIMQLDPRYAFFRMVPDDGSLPAGAAAVTLVAGRSLAVDTRLHDLGELLWIDASAPALNGAFPIYRRLAVALDTGGAIKGEVRADLYLGLGPAAGLEAGRVRHVLRLYRLVPVTQGGL